MDIHQRLQVRAIKEKFDPQTQVYMGTYIPISKLDEDFRLCDRRDNLIIN